MTTPNQMVDVGYDGCMNGGAIIGEGMSNEVVLELGNFAGLNLAPLLGGRKDAQINDKR